VGGSAVKANTLAFSGIVNVYGSVEVEYSYATPVPEPALSAYAMGLAALGLCLMRRRSGSPDNPGVGAAPFGVP
jgi:hypothetical protein